ncbi:MAG: nuclear transport factor 2 family protein [Terracidiphilus sp.]
MPALNPEECDQLFAQRLNAGNVDALLELYEPQSSHICPGGAVPHGREAVRSVLHEFVAMHPTLNVEVKNVVRAGDDLAVLYDNWTLAANGPNGEPIQMNGTGVHIVRRQHDGTWAFAVTGVSNTTW